MNLLIITRKLVRPGFLSNRWPAEFMLIAGAILSYGGITKLLGFFENSPMSDLADPVSGISLRYELLAVALIELTIAYVCLFTNKKTLSLSLIGWSGISFLVYQIGLWCLNCHIPTGWENQSFVMENHSPRMADSIRAVTAVFMVVGSGAIFWNEDQVSKKSKSLKMSCPDCGGHIQFSTLNVGQTLPCPHCQKTITLRKAENLKMSCFFCQEHIEFPPHALGQKIPCPHCAKDITLLHRDLNL
jgi:Zn finger protein HypA/HybF involved in hydrogenase expression